MLRLFKKYRKTQKIIKSTEYNFFNGRNEESLSGILKDGWTIFHIHSFMVYPDKMVIAIAEKWTEA